VRVLEALKIFEAATIECKTRDIDTPEVREALDVVAPYCRPEWRVTGFRDHLKRSDEFGPGGEGQQQNLRVYFGGNPRQCPAAASNADQRARYSLSKDEGFAAKAELDRLTAELAALPERWDVKAKAETSDRASPQD